jgi:hypothetical protein
MPKHKPAAIETIRKAKKGLILAQLTKSMSSTIQKSITNIVLHSGVYNNILPLAGATNVITFHLFKEGKY